VDFDFSPLFWFAYALIALALVVGFAAGALIF
jgi:hypothetical protein